MNIWQFVFTALGFGVIGLLIGITSVLNAIEKRYGKDWQYDLKTLRKNSKDKTNET